MPCSARSRTTARSQEGMALIVGLVLLVVMLVLGLAAVRLVAGEERMSTYMVDRTLAFQAAEAALREGEALIEQVQPTPTAGCSDVTKGTFSVRACAAPAPAATPRWLDATFNDWTNATTVGAGSLALTPQYFVEYLGNTFPCGPDPNDPPACKRFRVTARAGGAGRAETMVQSLYATD